MVHYFRFIPISGQICNGLCRQIWDICPEQLIFFPLKADKLKSMERNLYLYYVKTLVKWQVWI